MKKHIKTRPDCQQKKWNSKVKGLPFPSDIVRIGKLLNLTKEQRLFLLILLASMNTKNRKCWKSQAELAEEMGCRRGTVGRVSACLEERGIIRVKNRERIGRRHEYSFRFPWPASISMCSEPDMHVPPTGHDHVPLTGHGHVPPTGHGHVPPTGHYNVTTQCSPENESSSSMAGEEDEPQEPGQEDQGENLVPALHDQLPFQLDPEGWTRKVFPAFDPGRESWQDYLARYERGGSLNVGAVFHIFRDGNLFRELHGVDLDIPRSGEFEDRLDLFVSELLRRHWKGGEWPGEGIRTMLRRAGRLGLLSAVFGFDPEQEIKSSLGIVVVEEGEEIYQGENAWEIGGSANVEQPDGKKEMSEMERKLLEFLNQSGVRDYVDEYGLLGGRVVDLDRARNHLRDIKEKHGLHTLRDLKRFMVGHMEALNAQRERNANLRDFSKMLAQRPDLFPVLDRMGLLPEVVDFSLLNPGDFGPALDHFNELAEENGFESFEEIAEFLTAKAEKAA